MLRLYRQRIQQKPLHVERTAQMSAGGAHGERGRLALRRTAFAERRELRDDDPVIFFEHKSLYATKGEVPDGEIVDRLGSANIVRPGRDATILALALMVPRALEAAERLKSEH